MSAVVFMLGSLPGGATAQTEVKVSGTTADRKGFNPLNFHMSSLDFKVTYQDAKAASSAKLVKLPLPDGKEWAMTARWDDSNSRHLKMHKVMSKYGYKGSFYLTSAFRKGQPKGVYITLPKDLVSGDFTLGGHSLTHPKLPNQSKSDMFREVALIRPELEASSDKPVVSFAFPYGSYRTKEHLHANDDIAEALFRTGYHNNIYSSFIKLTKSVSPRTVSTGMPVRPGDRNTSVANMDRFIARNLKNKRGKQANPCMTLSTHTWMRGKDWDALDAALKKYAHNPKWWYCNQNQYAAYRYAFFHSKITQLRLEGNSVYYRITLPQPRDLGAAVPLSISAPGATAVTGKGFTLKKSKNTSIINIDNPEGAVPEKIDAVKSDDSGKLTSLAADGSRDFPNLDFKLSYNKSDNALMLNMKNQSGSSVKNIEARMMLPLAFPADDNWIKLGQLAGKEDKDFVFKLPAIKQDSKYNSGKQTFIIQVDFIKAGKPGRIFSVCAGDTEMIKTK